MPHYQPMMRRWRTAMAMSQPGVEQDKASRHPPTTEWNWQLPLKRCGLLRGTSPRLPWQTTVYWRRPQNRYPALYTSSAWCKSEWAVGVLYPVNWSSRYKAMPVCMNTYQIVVVHYIVPTTVWVKTGRFDFTDNCLSVGFRAWNC